MKLRKLLSLLLAVIIICSVAAVQVGAADTDTQASGAGYYNLNKYSDQVYTGTDLGCTYTPTATTFKVWSPAATKVQVKLYKTGTDRENNAGVIGTYDLTKGTKSVWSVTLQGDHKNQYYTYLITAKNTSGTTETNETQDIYSKAVGCNGDRSMVVDLNDTNPDGWADDKHVLFNNKTEAAVWELHIRDFSADPDSGVSEENQGNYLAFTEGGTTYKKQGSIKTCIDYLVENNINCVQLLPFADYDQIDENYGDSADTRNWGYNPKNYNVPDGAYSSNPYDGNVRIKEAKQMIQALHDRGISVVMDVVYNHTAGYAASCFTKTVPGYYYRMLSATQYSGGSGQGNELASENGMVRNFIIQSLAYWASEYHIDGFRFDLMGCIDVTTLNQARQKLNSLYSDGSGQKILMYGEPWAGGTTYVQTGPSATNARTALNKSVGVFSEEFTDNAVDTKGNGSSWLSGTASKAGTVVNGIKGNIIDSNDNTKSVNFIDNHDNYTIWDRIVGAKTTSGEGKKSVTTGTGNVNSTAANYTNQLKLAGVLGMTTQGIKFMNSGDEFARTKQGTKNSYNSPDSVNMLDWKRVGSYKESVDYFKGLRQINEVYTPFHDDSTTSKGTMSFIQQGAVIAYTINNNTSNKANEWGKVAVLMNAGSSAANVSLSGSWTVVANDKQAGVKALGTASGSYSVPAKTGAILVETSGYKDFSSKFTYGTLTTNHYVNGTLSKTTKALYRIGTKYHALKDSSLLIRNNLTKTDGTASGTFNGDTTVSYYYESNGKSMGNLNVKYVDASGKVLTPSMSYLLEAGAQYNIPVCAVQGYQLNTDRYPAGTTGTFDGTDKTIEFIYKPLDSQVTTIHYYNASKWNYMICYCYTDDGEEPLGPWVCPDGIRKHPGRMSADTAKGANWYKITIPVASCYVMFHDESANQEPAQNEPGYPVAGDCTIQNKIITYNSTLVTSHIDIATGKKLKADTSVTASKKSVDQYTTQADMSLGKLVATPANSTGFYQAGVINVVYLYNTGSTPEPTQAPTQAPTQTPTQTPTQAPTAAPTTQPQTTVPPTTAAPIVVDSYILGDSNCDGQVNIMDVTFIQQYLVNLTTFDKNNERNSDVDGDGRTSIKDANYIQRHLVGMVIPYEIGKEKKETVPAPTQAPQPTAAPTQAPTDAPTDAPTEPPTEEPTDYPTDPEPEYATVLFSNSKFWDGEITCYYWFDGSDGEVAWPGAGMTFVGKNDYGQDQYSIEVPVGCNVIFTNGTSQTADAPFNGETGFYPTDDMDDNGHYIVGSW